jgi:hypothetical protein
MSLKINKDNIFCILPEDRYSVSKKIDGFMADDFTLFVKAKINTDSMETDKDYFLFSRNGMHSGISVYRDVNSNIHAVFNWWFTNETGENEYKCVTRKIEEQYISDFNEYSMICDESKKQIHCYFNNELVGIISYENFEKEKYENTFYWFGCGSMMCEPEHRRIGDFDFNLSFLLNKKIEFNKINDIVKNYKESYTIEMFDGVRKLKDDFELKDNFAFFCDFENHTKYKIWDMTFSGNYPQIYIEDNIYF